MIRSRGLREALGYSSRSRKSAARGRLPTPGPGPLARRNESVGRRVTCDGRKLRSDLFLWGLSSSSGAAPSAARHPHDCVAPGWNIDGRPGAVEAGEPKQAGPEAPTVPTDMVKPDFSEEVVIALVGPLGADLEIAERGCSEILASFGYAMEKLRLSDLLAEVFKLRPVPEYDAYITSRMDAGDQLRDRTDLRGAVAMLAVHEIATRRGAWSERDDWSGRTAYILRSLKTPAELALLREVYGPRLLTVGVHMPRRMRIDALAHSIAASQGSTHPPEWEEAAVKLVNRDEKDSTTISGQNVSGTFPRADVFIDAAQLERSQTILERYLRASFSSPFETPTRDEFAMFHAWASGERSSDLSRQVGAAITSNDGDILAVGSNEVPKFGGGAYWVGDEPDMRDFRRRVDANKETRDTALTEAKRILKEQGWLSAKGKSAGLETWKRVMRDSRIGGLTEFSRAVHAEMAALLDAARRGVAVSGHTLHTTTFPCHNCAKHVVSAGLTRVVYIEPYPKSLAQDLHPDAIAIDPAQPVSDKVRFEPFCGIAPVSYGPLFSMGSLTRADDGKVVPFQPLKATPRLATVSDLTYMEREEAAWRALVDAAAGNVPLPRKRRQSPW